MVIKIAKSNVFTLDEKYNKNYKLEIGKMEYYKKKELRQPLLLLSSMLKSIVEIDE